ncbi:hypothetical protein Scep_010472 [Stephania cephalantha]|uniref:Uncharacterized protein n=1 Tax=Stephania cephalantha TaxID=152367 RepID=A0AAP0JVH3_9MAGN
MNETSFSLWCGLKASYIFSVESGSFSIKTKSVEPKIGQQHKHATHDYDVLSNK